MVVRANPRVQSAAKKGHYDRGDARGTITSHRARSTISSQLFNAKEPLSLLDLQAWLGHRSPASTQHYARISPTKLAQSYEDAGYSGRNLRAVEVLLDRASAPPGPGVTTTAETGAADSGVTSLTRTGQR